MSSPQSNPENFDVVALCREFRDEVVPKKQRPLNISWERECRPILIDAAINDLDTSVVLEFLQKHQVPFPKSPEAAERKMQQWLARIRKEIHLPLLPSGAKRSSPGYQEGLRRWKKTNPIPTVEEIIAGWRAKPVDYSDLNFYSLVDAYAPRTPKSKKPQATLPTPVENPILARCHFVPEHDTPNQRVSSPAASDSRTQQPDATLANSQPRQSAEHSETGWETLTTADTAITSSDGTTIGSVDFAQGPAICDLPPENLPYKQYQAQLMEIFSARASWLEELIESLKNLSIAQKEELYRRASKQINPRLLPRATYAIWQADAALIYRINELNPDDWAVEVGKARSFWDSDHAATSIAARD
jgi:hypothetical protein